MSFSFPITGSVVFCIFLFISCSLFPAANLHAQTPAFYFSPLSKEAYAKKITEIEQRKVPLVYTDKKEQKAYEDIIKSRDKSLKSDFENNELLDDTMLLNKCKRIIHRLMPANSKFPEDSIAVYINRSAVANACCHGEGTLYVNLGLFLWVDNDDELAFILAHELSHQFLDHVQSRIKKNIALLSSEDFINEMKAIKKSSDGRYERYKKLMKDLVTENGTHSRYKESEADSLAVILVRKGGYDVQKGSLILLKLDKVDDVFSGKNIYDLRSVFGKYGADVFLAQKNTRYNGLSMADVTMNADKDFDSVKTHPDCILRYTQSSGNTNPGTVDCCNNLRSPYADLKEHAMAEIIRYEYENRRLTLCSHLCLFAIQSGFKSPFYIDFLSSSFAGMYDADKHIEKFSVTDARAKTGSTLKELQDCIFNSNSEKLAAISEAFLKSAGETSSEDAAFAALKFNTQIKMEDAAAAEKKFLAAYPGSKYSYLLKPKTR